jgi:SAM-dependent methyltransferase
MVRHWFLRKLANNVEDRWRGISTGGIAQTDKVGAFHYATESYADTRRVLRALDLQPSDVFIDVGAGKGRVLCLAAKIRMRQVVGVEYSSELARIAKQNIRRMQGKQTPVEIYSRAAEDFDYSAATVLYFFNPFEANVLDVVLGKLDVDRAGKPLRLAFAFELPEHRAVFSRHKWLECYDHWVNSAGHAVALYRTTRSLA